MKKAKFMDVCQCPNGDFGSNINFDLVSHFKVESIFSNPILCRIKEQKIVPQSRIQVREP